MSNPWVVLAATVVLIGLSAFFVAVEFALLGARRYRLEEAAATSWSARAALRSSAELTVLLAGSQLGITACTLALGAVAKPALHHWLTPAIEWLGAPYVLADIAGFILALVVITFLHLVIGEMAPKSWAIAHPERSAILLALPMRAFMAVTRPVLVALNEAANWCLRRVGVEPAQRIVTGHGPDELRHLVQHSASVGALDLLYAAQLSRALDLRRLTVADVVKEHPSPVDVPATATAGEVRRVAHESGHLRILVRPDQGTVPTGVVHVRDTLLLDDDAPITSVTKRVFELDPTTPLYVAMTRMRESANHLAVVRLADECVRVVTMADILNRLLPSTTASATPSAAVSSR